MRSGQSDSTRSRGTRYRRLRSLWRFTVSPIASASACRIARRGPRAVPCRSTSSARRVRRGPPPRCAVRPARASRGRHPRARRASGRRWVWEARRPRLHRSGVTGTSAATIRSSSAKAAQQRRRAVELAGHGVTGRARIWVRTISAHVISKNGTQQARFRRHCLREDAVEHCPPAAAPASRQEHSVNKPVDLPRCPSPGARR